MDRNLRALGVGAVVRAFGVSLIGPFFALYLNNVLGVGYVEIGLLIVIIGVPPLLISSVGGLLADRVGRRRLFVISLVGEAAALFATAGAMALSSLVLVVAALAAFGIVSTLGGPALSAYVADFSFGSERTRAFTWFRVGHNLGFTLGVVAGGALVGIWGFVPVALVGGFFAAATVVFVLAVMDPSPYDLALAHDGASDPVAPPRTGSVRESLWILAHDRTFLVLCTGFAIAYVAVAQWQVTFPLFVHGQLGISYAVLGLGYGLNGVIVVLGQTATTNRVVGQRHTSIAVAGMFCYVVAFLALGIAGQFALLPVVIFFASVFILTIGENLMAIPQTTLPSNVAPATEVGAYNGAFQTITGIGPLVSIFVGGVALAYIANPLVLWTVLMLPAIPAAFLLRWAGRRIPGDGDRA